MNIVSQEIIRDIVALYPEAYEICLVGSYARNEQKEKSDVDILIKFSEDNLGWNLVCRDTSLWKKWNKKTIGKDIDFIIGIGGNSKCGQHIYREQENLPTPEIVLWRKNG